MTNPTAPVVSSETGLQAQGRALVMALYSAGQALKLYPIENAMVQKSLEELNRVAARIAEREGVLDLRAVGDFLFLNDVRLRLEISDFVAFSFLSSAFERHGVGSLEVGPAVERTEWAPLITLLQRDEVDEEDPFGRFSALLGSAPVRNIRVTSARATPDRDLHADEEAKEVAKRTYFQSVHVAREVLTDMRLGKAVNVRRVKRAVQSIVDQVLNDDTSILGMTTLRDYDEYTFTHSVNVCIFSVVIGQKLGLSKPQLYELGLGALFHDIGKMRIDPEVLNKPGALNEEEWDLMMQHPTEGLLSLFTMRGFTEAPFRTMLIAYEHHMKTDLTGYPTNKRPRRPGLFSRIIAVADGFDAATSARSYRKEPWPPDEVLEEMRNSPERGYDQLLVKAFLNVTGVFPVGTVVILDTYELAVVIARNPDPKRIHQPIVKIISDAMGSPVATPEVVDLSEVDPVTGEPKRSVIKTTDPEKYGIRVSDYFV